MPNGHDMIDLLDFEEKYKAMSQEDRNFFTAREVYKLSVQFSTLPCKSESCPTRGLSGRQKTGLWTAIGTALAALIVALIEYFRQVGR